MAFTTVFSATAQVKWLSTDKLPARPFNKVGEPADLSGYQIIEGDAPLAKMRTTFYKEALKVTDGVPAFTGPILTMPTSPMAMRAPLAGDLPYAWATQLGGLYETNNLVQFDLSDNIQPSTLLSTNYPVGQYGMQLLGDTLYTSYITFQSTPYGMAYAAFISKLNINTWKGVLGQINSVDFAAVAYAQANNGMLYGEFYNSRLNGYQIGKIDMSTLTRVTLGTGEQTYVAMGMTSDNRLYAIGIDGNLYELSTDNGAATLIGSTGVKVLNASGNYYAQGGDIDKNTNTFYWAAADSTGRSSLYTVDLYSGKASLITDMPNNTEYVSFFIPRTVQGGAPATPATPSVTFDGITLNGTFTFTSPEKTAKGNKLTGDLSYIVLCDYDDTLATGTTHAGATETVSITAPSKGFHYYKVAVANGYGTSDYAPVRAWAGADQPNIATNVVLAIDSDGTTHLTWDAPTATVNGGNMDTLITYNVGRYAKGTETTVATGITAREFSEKLADEGYTSYYYNVYAVNGDAVSDAAESNHVLFGSTIEVPYFEDFQKSAGFEVFTVLDNDKNGKTWSYNAPRARTNRNNGSAQGAYGSSYGVQADDWLLTPGIHLDPTKIYSISYQVNDVWAGSFNDMEVKIGTGEDPTAFATLQPTFRVSSTNAQKAGYTTYTFEFQPTVDGTYRLGFHDVTPVLTGTGAIRVDDISISYLSDISSPDSATNVVVNAGAKGALNAIIAFNVPAKNIDGSARASVDSIIVLKDGALLNKFEASNAGALLSCTDNDVAQGNHTYKITAYADGKPGRPVSKTIYVGLDTPAAPILVPLDNQNSVVFNWAEILGQHNGYIDQDQTTLTIYNATGYLSAYKGTQAAQFTASQKTGSLAVNLDEGTPQSLLRYIAEASNATGTSSSVYTDYLIKGKPYDLPYRESNANGINDHHFYVYDLERESGATGGFYMSTTTAASVDDDGGAIIVPGQIKGDITINNYGKINLRGTTNPMGYVFVANTIANNPLRLSFFVRLPDKTVDTLKVVNAKDLRTGYWTELELDLRKYAGQRFVELFIKGYMTADKVNTSNADYLFVDNINIFDQLDKNLTAQEVKGPNFIHAGETGSFTASIRNLGKNAASSYKVVSIVDGVPVDTVDVNENLHVAMNKQVTLPLPVKFAKKDSISFQAKVIYDGDLDEDDDLSDIGWVKVRTDAKPTPTSLTATSEPNTVTLNWVAPDTTGFKKVTDDFEAYEPFTDQFGEWRTYDNDGGVWPMLNDAMSYPGQGQHRGFMIWRPDSVFKESPIPIDMTAHSGKQYAMIALQVDVDSYGESTFDQVRIEGNQMLMSPELSGREQTVTFWVKNASWTTDVNDTLGTYYREYFWPYYSTTTNDPTAFQSLGPSYTVQGGKWQELSYDVPEGAKFFCIWWSTENGYFFSVDDFTYESVYGGSTSPLTGYNIYRDGVLIGHVDANGNATFTDTTADDGVHVYTVTATYADGSESDYSNEASVTVVTGIDAIENELNAPSYNVYSVDGKALQINAKSLKDLNKGVYIINNKKVVVK